MVGPFVGSAFTEDYQREEGKSPIDFFGSLTHSASLSAGGSLENERECRRRRADVCVLERRKRRGFLLKQTSRLDDDDDDDDGRERGA